MSITGGIVLFAVIWFMTLFVTLQIGAGRSQDEQGEIAPGTPAGAPADLRIGRIAMITTVVTVVLWSVIAAIIIWGGITIYDLDWFGRLGPRSEAG